MSSVKPVRDETPSPPAASEPAVNARAVRPPRAGPPWGWLAVFASTVVVCGTFLTATRTLGASARLPPASTVRTVVRPAPDVLVAVQGLARLESVSFHMERVIELSDEQTHLFGLVAASDRILLVASAEVSAGVDLSRLRAGDVNVDWPRRRVSIELPAAELFRTTVDNARTRTYRRDTDALAARSEDLETRARQEAERAMRDAALRAGVLTRAREHADRALRTLLTSLGFAEVELRWRDAGRSNAVE